MAEGDHIYPMNNNETLQRAFGSGGNGIKMYREQEEWDQKVQGAGRKGKVI